MVWQQHITFHFVWNRGGIIFGNSESYTTPKNNQFYPGLKKSTYNLHIYQLRYTSIPTVRAFSFYKLFTKTKKNEEKISSPKYFPYQIWLLAIESLSI